VDRWLETGRNNCPACRTQVRFSTTSSSGPHSLILCSFAIRAYLPQGRSLFHRLRRQLTSTWTRGSTPTNTFGPLVVVFQSEADSRVSLCDSSLPPLPSVLSFPQKTPCPRCLVFFLIACCSSSTRARCSCLFFQFFPIDDEREPPILTPTTRLQYLLFPSPSLMNRSLPSPAKKFACFFLFFSVQK